MPVLKALSGWRPAGEFHYPRAKSGSWKDGRSCAVQRPGEKPTSARNGSTSSNALRCSRKRFSGNPNASCGKVAQQALVHWFHVIGYGMVSSTVPLYDNYLESMTEFAVTTWQLSSHGVGESSLINNIDPDGRLGYLHDALNSTSAFSMQSTSSGVDLITKSWLGSITTDGFVRPLSCLTPSTY